MVINFIIFFTHFKYYYQLFQKVSLGGTDKLHQLKLDARKAANLEEWKDDKTLPNILPLKPQFPSFSMSSVDALANLHKEQKLEEKGKFTNKTTLLKPKVRSVITS